MSYITHTEKLFHGEKNTLVFIRFTLKHSRIESIKHTQDPMNTL